MLHTLPSAERSREVPSPPAATPTVTRGLPGQSLVIQAHFQGSPDSRPLMDRTRNASGWLRCA